MARSLVDHLLSVQPNPDNRPQPKRQANAPQYGDTFGSINGRPLPYRYGGNRRGNLKNSGDPYGGNRSVRA